MEPATGTPFQGPLGRSNGLVGQLYMNTYMSASLRKGHLYPNVNLHAFFFISTSNFRTSLAGASIFGNFRLKWCLTGACLIMVHFLMYSILSLTLATCGSGNKISALSRLSTLKFVGYSFEVRKESLVYPFIP